LPITTSKIGVLSGAERSRDTSSRMSFMLDVSVTMRKKQLCVYFTAGDAGQDASDKEDAPTPLHVSSNMLLKEFYADLKGLANMPKTY
ncbi:hypothetical protein CYMTET_12696, partial [Cymbomonas tetramitiformis]